MRSVWHFSLKCYSPLYLCLIHKASKLNLSLYLTPWTVFKIKRFVFSMNLLFITTETLCLYESLQFRQNIFTVSVIFETPFSISSWQGTHCTSTPSQWSSSLSRGLPSASLWSVGWDDRLNDRQMLVCYYYNAGYHTLQDCCPARGTESSHPQSGWQWRWGCCWTHWWPPYFCRLWCRPPPPLSGPATQLRSLLID